MSHLSFTQNLVESDPDGFQRATQSPFLKQAAQGTLSKEVLGKWLANDRIYIHSYIRGIGHLLSFLQVPSQVTTPGTKDSAATRLLDWMVDALVNIRREEKFFVDTAAQYGITVDLERQVDGTVLDSAKLEGLCRFETLFNTLSASEGQHLPWLECAVVFWGTEKCYLDAWSWAKSQLDETQDGSQDADGGALRNEFIGNWTGKEFQQFVEQLGEIIDEGVRQAIETHGDMALNSLRERAEAKWRLLIEAEMTFWPAVD